MNYLDLINSVVLIVLTVGYFQQNNQLKFMKTAMDSYQPEKLKQAKEYIEEGMNHKFNVAMDLKTREIISEASKDFQDVHKTLIEQYYELVNFPMNHLISLDKEEREKMLKNYPKNYENLKTFLKAYDSGQLKESDS